MVLSNKDLAETHYSFIVDRLLNTIKDYSVKYDEFLLLKNDIKTLLTESSSLPFAKRLELVCHFLKKTGSKSYIIKLLYAELTEDYKAFKEERVDLSRAAFCWD
ncbi:hypothetical protein [Adhaeribacter aquaticus]|uniref:hypothetical protein n=1 Tax=Adhaeribacter aquaticus TaxID=299567 RepID=UPI0004180B37|nr:hypothetical protein [Adhaeribacter aquaticus]